MILKYVFYVTYKRSVSMSQRTNSSPSTKTNRLTLFREVMGVD